MQMQLYVYRYSLDVVATSYELYSLFGMQSLAGRGRRKIGVERGSSRAAGYFLSILLLLSLCLSPSASSSFLPSDWEDHDQREHKGAFAVLFSPSKFRSSISSKVDEKRKERQIVRKIVSLFTDMPAGESEEWPSRGRNWKSPLFKGNRFTEIGESETRGGNVEWRLASGCKNSRVTSQVTVST